MKDALLGLILFALMLCTAFCVGRLFLRGLRVWARTGECVIFALALGMGVIAYLALGVGLLGGLKPFFFQALTPVWVLGGIGAGHAFWEMRSAPSRRAAWSPLAWACAVVLAALGLFTLVGALAPPGGMEWDALSYHLAAPKTFLRAGRIFTLPWDHHSSFPLTLQMLYLLMLGQNSAVAAKLCHWICGALLVLSVISFAARHGSAAHGKTIGLAAALILAATPVVLWEMSVAYADLATALFTWLSLYALFNAAAATPGAPLAPNHPQERVPGGAGMGEKSVPWLVVSAVLMGLALGTKYTVLGFWGILLAGILGWHLWVRGRWARETLPHALLWGGVSLLVAAPWYLRTWITTGNPVYPFFYNLFGGRYWSAGNAALYAADQAAFGLGKTPVQFLLAPWQATMEVEVAARLGKPFLFTEYVAFGLSPVFIALLLAAPLLGRRLSRTSVLLTLFGGGVYVFWFFVMQQTRYLIPVLPALAIVCAEILIIAWQDLRFARWPAAGFVAASVIWGLYLSATGIAAPALPVVTGRITRSQYLARTLPGLSQACAFINRATPRNAGVALFDEVRGFPLDRDYLWATPNHSTFLPWDRYAGVDDWLADFRRRGTTTLLVNRRFAPRADDGQIWRRLLPEAVTDGKVTLVFEERGVQVYRIEEAKR